MKLKMLGLLGALIFAAPVAAIAAPAGGLTAQTVAPVAAPAVDTNAAATPGTNAKIEKVWWHRGWGYGYGWHRPWGYGYGWHRPWGYGYGWHRPWGWHRRYYW